MGSVSEEKVEHTGGNYPGSCAIKWVCHPAWVLEFLCFSNCTCMDRVHLPTSNRFFITVSIFQYDIIIKKNKQILKHFLDQLRQEENGKHSFRESWINIRMLSIVTCPQRPHPAEDAWDRYVMRPCLRIFSFNIGHLLTNELRHVVGVALAGGWRCVLWLDCYIREMLMILACTPFRGIKNLPYPRAPVTVAMKVGQGAFKDKYSCISILNSM